MKYISNIIVLFCIAVAVFSCQREEFIQNGENNQETPAVGVFGDEMVLSLNMVSPDPLSVETKGVDPDGTIIRTMNFFCFDENGIFLKVVPADFTASTYGDMQFKGQITVSVPHNSRVMHILCNLNMNRFSAEAFEGKTEQEVISGIESASGLLIYWARIAVPSNVTELYTNVTDANLRSEGEAVVDWITIETNPENETHKGVAGKGNPIHLMRNQAKVTVSSYGATDEKGWDGTDFVVTGFSVFNSQAFGTVAPYHTEQGYPSFGSLYNPDNWSQESYITLPENRDMLNDIKDVDNFRETHIFESPNSISNPVEVIIKGYNIVSGEPQQEQYYKVQIMDLNEGLIPIRRNHHYRFTVAGHMYNGANTFDDAVKGPAANNIWLSISDEVKSVADAMFKLSIDNNTVIRRTRSASEENETVNLGFSVEKLGSLDLNTNNLSVTWLDESQNVGTLGTVSFDASTGKGTIPVTLNKVQTDGEDVLKGTIVVQYRQLFRRIKLIVTPVFEFIPVYASSEGIQGQNDHVTLVYTIPDNVPEEMFPFNVLVNTNDLDIRSGTGQKLSIVNKTEDGYGETFDLTIDGNRVKDSGYKYIMPITGPGIRRLYLQTLEDEVLNNYNVYVTLESESFYMHHEPVNLNNTQYEEYLKVKNMNEYSTGSGGKVYYKLVPPKRYAPVTFDLATLRPGIASGEPDEVNVGITTEEEFLLYSGKLDHYADDDDRITDEFRAQFDCNFVPYKESTWGDDGRVFGFYPRQDIPEGEFSIFLETNSPKSEEVVFIVSNNTNNVSVKNSNNNYGGQQFRSATFELANYRPYRFASAIYDADGLIGSADTTVESPETDISTDYTDINLSVEFDVTSYAYTDGSSIDPFGYAFEVYIDAPMYNLSSTQIIPANAKVVIGGVEKPKLEQLENGRIIYRVDADRDTEAAYWNTSDMNVNITDNLATSQEGERKRINLVAKSQISAGLITISADPEHIAYYSETYNVSNNPIQVVLKYGASETIVPFGYAVSFYNKNTGNRIYSTTIDNTEGKCDFYLTPERPLDWLNDPIIVNVQVGGVFYSAEIASASYLYDNRIVTMAEGQ